MLNISGINYFNSIAGVSPEILYAFTGSSGNIIYNSITSNLQYSGIISNTGNFYQKNGSGFLNGGNIAINNATGLSYDSWTMILTYEISGGNTNGVLFSNYSSGMINSGFCLGITNTLQPFIEYYSDSGPQIVKSNNNWGSKNTIFLTKVPNGINLDYFNYNSKKFESESFNINDTFFLESSDWRLGVVTGQPNYFSGNNFRGFIDYFTYYSPALSPNQKYIVSSGLFTDITPTSPYVTYETVSQVTGYITGQNILFSGVTGQQLQLVSNSSELCSGEQFSNYQLVDLTGIIYEQWISGLTQNVTISFTGYSGSSILENTGYRKSFAMQSTSYLKDVDSNDLSELYYYSGVDINNLNNTLIYDRGLEMFVLPDDYNLNNVNFYLNGVANFGSGYSYSGNLYSNTIILSGTYYISGNYLSGENYDGDDFNIVDFINGSGRSYFNVTGLNSGILYSGLNSGYMFFINGQKIKPTLSSSELLFITGQITGQVFSFPIKSGFNYSSGANNIITNGFSRNTSQLYLNGIRQVNKIDYLEIPNISLLNSGSNYLNNIQNIYNNNNNYIEYL